MKTNKFIENSTKELLDRLKESFANKNVEYKESNQLALLRRISNIKMSICAAENTYYRTITTKCYRYRSIN